MRNAMEEIGTERVLFSIAAEIGENDREVIGRGNAALLFNLSQTF
jgi:hypothetical protein